MSEKSEQTSREWIHHVERQAQAVGSRLHGVDP